LFFAPAVLGIMIGGVGEEGRGGCGEQVIHAYHHLYIIHL